MNSLKQHTTKNQVFTRYELFLLQKIFTLYTHMNRAAELNDFELGFKFLGELEDTEARALDAGLSRRQICDFVELEVEKEAEGAA